VPETATATRRGANWEARREAIIDTSARVFAHGGYHGTGIAELCEANDLGKGALYHYIGSKEELLEAIHDRVMDEVLKAADRVAESTAPAAERLTAIGTDLLSIMERYPDHVWVFLHEFPALTGARAKKFRQRRRSFESAVEQVIVDGIASGEFRDVDPRLAMLGWYGMFNYTYLWLRPDGKLAAHEVAERFADLFLNGLSIHGIHA